ncbi:MAG: LacI family transcriptional regulator [Lachnospiraceae bacterium]|nr:LacI family transcriptional regulator [Lachnospiraceae bacterium]
MDGNRGNEGRPITIYDIAKEANVSAATVSRVLTNSTKVRKDKRERILGLMEKYNFRPNAMARGLADTRSKTIGIMVADVRNPFYSEAFVACEAAAARRGYTMLLCNSYCDKEQEKILLEKLAEKRVDAIIQMGGRADELCTNAEYAEYVNRMIQNIPMLVTGKLDGTDCYQLQINAPESMELIMDYLAELGHEKIAFLGGFDNVLSTNEKEAVYRKKLAERGISLPERLYRQEGTYDYRAGYDTMNTMLEAGERPTAVIAINENTAIGVMASIREHGLSIPEDISIVSYDNTYMAELATPRLTSVDYNYGEFGERIIRSVVAAIEGEEVPKLQYMGTRLVVRETTGRVKGARSEESV